MSLPSEVLLIQVDIKANNERLVELTKQLNENRTALKALNDANKAGTLSADELAAGQVRLKTAAAAIGQETRTLTKANQAQDAANKASVGSIEQLRAQLATGTAAYNALSAAERDNTAAGQQLQATNRATSDQLKVLEGAIGDTRRNVGNYAGSIGPLIQELVKLQEQQKTVGQGSVEYQNITKQIGFVTKATQDAGAKAGLSYEQTQAKLKEYGDAVRPVIAEVVKLEKEQEKLDDSGEAYTRIGFKLAGLKTKVAEVPVEAKKLTGSFREAVVQTGLLGGVTETYTAIKARYTAVVGAARTATIAEAGALNILRVALIATGLGALVVVLGSVVVFLTKTAEGTRLVENVMAQVGAVVSVVIDRLGALGKAVVQVLSGDFTGAATTAKAAFSGLGDEIGREVKLAGDLSKAQQQLDRDTANNIDTNKRLLNEVERLKNVRDNEFNTLQVRKKANEDAFAVELQREKTLADLARRRIAILKAEIDQRGGESKVSLDQLKAYKEAQNELSDILEDAAGKQNELITNRFQLNKTGLDAQKAAAAASEALRKKRDEDMLKSIEAEMAAGATREAAAAAYLAREDAARIADLAKQEKARTDGLAAEKASYDRDLAMLERNLDERRVAVERANAQGLSSQAEYERQLRGIEAGGLAAGLMLANKNKQDMAAEVKAIADYEIKETRRVLAEKKRIEEIKQDVTQATLGAGLAATDATIEAFGEESAAGQAALAIKKTLALAEIGINLQKQLAANAVAGAKISAEAPPVTIPLGIAYTVATDALAIAAGAAGAAKILGFATGGYVSGPGTGTSDSIPARLSNGESVMNANTTAMFAPLLSHLNQLGGGVAFASGGLVPGATPRATPINDGGFVARQLGGSAAFDYNALAQAMSRVNLEVGVTPLRKVQARYDAARSMSTLG